ncbi:TIMELESS-interacting protein-like isoform X2 [Parambassis ranga]|uniref:TIMELESS-interacting protein n=1 Tax=Parambassis ranga TaxID=210632 RepID=A0A6P7HVM3_9TELE|nr:TIMELESS-interacting protein-like isoform X2 [Parambassis ranga]
MVDLQDEDMNDISDYNNLEDEAFPPLPPPGSPDLGGQEDGDLFANDVEGELSKLADVPAAKRSGVKRPQPKLDSQRLISDKGLPLLRTLFDSVRFKGKGHEAEDLRLLMQRMENWAHRLYPRLQFEDFIDKVEKLGSKKEVQTCLKRIRLDMPLTHEDFAEREGDEEAPPELQVFGDPDLFSREGFINDPQGPISSTPAPAAPPAPSLTEEQRQRIELNRQRALERRLARQQPPQTDHLTVDTSSLKNESAPMSSANSLNGSSGQDEKVEDLEPVSSSTQQQRHNQQQQTAAIQLPDGDFEPPAESTRTETSHGPEEAD